MEDLKRELKLIVRAVREGRQDQAKDLAAVIAFWSFFSIFPLLIGILSLAGYFIESAQMQSRIYEVVSDLLPGSAGLVRDNLKAVVRHRGTMGWVGIGGLLWTAGKGFGAVIRAVNRAIGEERPHSFLLSMARQFFMAVAVSVLAIASTVITLALEFIFDAPFLSRLGLGEVKVPSHLGWIMSFVLIFLVFTLIYKFAPYGDVQWGQVLPGALLAAVLFELGKGGFVLYLDRMTNFEAVYGPLSSIIVLLLWLYLSALILVFGAEYNIVRWKAGTENAATVPETRNGNR